MSRREELEFIQIILVAGFLLLSGVCVLGGMGVLAYQIIDWLKTGEWLPIPFWKGFEMMDFDLGFIFEIEWRGLQKILLWLLSLPLSMMLPVTGILLAMIAGQFWPLGESLQHPSKPRPGSSDTE